MHPVVSIIVPVYNRSAFLRPALDSLFQQTFGDFEIVVVDDGSRDDTPVVLANITDSRLKVITHGTNLGIAEARNSGLEAARGQYIAWLDSDDVCRRSRLEKQVRFLETHPEVALVGGCAGKIDARARRMRGIRVPPFDPKAVRACLVFKSAFQQSSVMGRANVLKSMPYDGSFAVCEDTDLFVRLAARYRIANLPAMLVDRRIHEGQFSHQCSAQLCAAQARIGAPQLAAMGVQFTQEDLVRHACLARLSGAHLTDDYVRWADAWFNRLVQANRRTGTIDGAALEFVTNVLRFQLRRRRGEAILSSVVRSRVLTSGAASWAALAASAAIRDQLHVQRSV